MSDVETTEQEREQAARSEILIVRILEILKKKEGMMYWKYKVIDNRSNEFLLQTGISPEELLPIIFKIDSKYIVPIRKNKSGTLGYLDGEHLDLLSDYENGNVSTIPLDEQGGSKEIVDKITENDMAILSVTDESRDNVIGIAEVEEVRIKKIPKPAPNDKPDREMLARSSNLPSTGSQLAVELCCNKAVMKDFREHQPNCKRRDLRTQSATRPILNIESIIKYLCPKANEQQAFMFLQMCAAQELNPFVGDAYLIAYWNKDTKQYDTSMIVAKDAFLKRAEKLVDYEGFEAGIIVLTSEGVTDRREGSFKLGEETLLGGWARVYRKGLKPFLAEVAQLDYNTGKNLWTKKAATMIRKVALVQAMREAFPASFQGMYDRSEIDVEENKK